MASQTSWAPTRKLWTGGLAGLGAMGVVYVGRRYLNWDVDPELAMVIVLASAKSVAYLVPPAARDQILKVDTEVKAAENEVVDQTAAASQQDEQPSTG